MTSRERVMAALAHEEPDRVPVDLGGAVVTGIHASALARLREALGLESRRIKVYEPMMMLGTVEPDVLEAVGGDVVGLNAPGTLLGYRNEDWQEWTLPDGTEILMGGGFRCTRADDGTIYAYPQGDTSARASARMPADGLYFDNIIRQDALSGTDFGAQTGLFISPACYREFYKPYHRIFNDWVHENTSWKVFFHTCGAVADLMEDFIEVGVDIINPVQVSADGMAPEHLKSAYGDRIVFWGGGVDPQRTMPFGTPEEVTEETRRNVATLRGGGGFVCAAIHNIQGPTPVENILAFFRSING